MFTSTQEIVSSQLSQSEINSILTINAGVEGAIDFETTAYYPGELNYHKAGIGAIIGAAMLAVGLVIFFVAGSQPSEGNRDSNLTSGFVLILLGMALAIITEQQ